ncbi:MAG TPA: ATP-binding protein [Acidobacteriaceae bacterium]|jgi:SpoVK/Ycf46/Vps4 family AAA+-type ATPase|nr:ATP-binding protein [Acidobacteriaceae bacterium]
MSSTAAGIATHRGEAIRQEIVPPFCSGGEHLLTELDRLRWLVRAEILRMRAANVLNENQFRGLYISDEQVDAILNLAPAEAVLLPEAVARLRDIEDHYIQAAKCETRTMMRRAASVAAGIVLPLDCLETLFSLSLIERDVLLLSIAPEIDPNFETLFSYAQNDVTRKRPTVGLILRLLGKRVADRLELRTIFSPTQRLMQGMLLRFCDDAQEREAPLLSRSLRPEERIVSFLLEDWELESQIDSRLRSFTRCIKPSRTLASLHLPKELIASLLAASGIMREQGGILFFHGATGTGKRAAAEAISTEAGRALVVADLGFENPASAAATTTFALLRREATLCGANLLLSRASAWLAEENPQRQQPLIFSQALSEAFAGSGLTVFVASESLWPVVEKALDCAWSVFTFPIPDFSDRVKLWQEAFDAIGANPPQGTPSVLANRFILTGGQIEGACRAARTHALMRGQQVANLTQQHLEAEARAQSNQSLQRHAQKAECRHEWSDLVLPARTIQQLREICAAEKFRSVVYADWGFGRRMSQGKGLNVLFCGPSGTGKTMSAGIVARELGLDLYKIDLSTVISKYIGETEKHLSQIFREAQSSNAILFFDEADAIFGKRSEVKDAHDRYANVEVAYLLQKMEEYEGIVILATNFRKNIDDSFTRRIQYIVEFPFPEASYRERIWRSMVPAAAPLAKDVDFGFLARQFELAGGSICNAALVAAFNAAEEGGAMRMEHFVLAVARELQKMGKLPARSDFGEYYGLTRERT